MIMYSGRILGAIAPFASATKAYSSSQVLKKLARCSHASGFASSMRTIFSPW